MTALSSYKVGYGFISRYLLIDMGAVSKVSGRTPPYIDYRAKVFWRWMERLAQGQDPFVATVNLQ